MQAAIDALLSQLATMLAPLDPLTEAVVPAALGLATAGVKCAFDGRVDANSLVIAGCGLVAALVGFLVARAKAKTPAPAPASAKKAA